MGLGGESDLCRDLFEAEPPGGRKPLRLAHLDEERIFPDARPEGFPERRIERGRRDAGGFRELGRGNRLVQILVQRQKRPCEVRGIHRIDGGRFALHDSDRRDEERPAALRLRRKSHRPVQNAHRGVAESLDINIDAGDGDLRRGADIALPRRRQA